MGNATDAASFGARVPTPGVNSAIRCFQPKRDSHRPRRGHYLESSLGGGAGDVMLRRRESRLDKDSVINVSQLVTLSKEFLVDRVGRIPPVRIREVDGGLRLVLSL